MSDITLTSAPVTWRVANLIQGATARGANGYVEFEASAVAVHHGAMMWLPSPQRAEVVDGTMKPLELPINNPDVWNWKVTPRLGVNWTPFHINVEEGGTNLATAAIVPGKGPVKVLQGPPGASIVDFRDTGDGALVLILSDGTESPPVPFTRGPAGPANEIEIGTVIRGDEAYAALVGEAPHQRLNLTLPKGDQGDEGPRGKGVPDGNPDGMVVAADGTATAWRAPRDLIPAATSAESGLMSAQDKRTVGTYRIGPENVFAGEGAGESADPDATLEGSGSAGGYENAFVGAQAGAANIRGWKNSAFGAFALRDCIDGFFNVAIGNSAMERTIGGIGDGPKDDNSPGARNTAVGSNALRYNTTGRGNTAIGRNSAHSSLTGSYITAVGTNAYSGKVDGDVHSQKTADEVTAVGWGAAFNTDAPQSTAVGTRALYQSANPDSYGGTAVGNRALEKSEARENTALGNLAGQHITTGRWNIAVGPRSLGANSAGVTGNANLAIGTAPLQQVTSGQYNVGIGQEALMPVTTGTFNTAIGHQTGQSTPSNLSGGTAIGAGANALHTNSTAIGRSVSTTAPDQVAFGRRHIEIQKAYGAPPVPPSGVRLWAEGDGAATVLKAIFPDGRIATIA